MPFSDDRVMDEDVMEYLKSLGLKGSPDSLELEILKMPTLDVVTAGLLGFIILLIKQTHRIRLM